MRTCTWLLAAALLPGCPWGDVSSGARARATIGGTDVVAAAPLTSSVYAVFGSEYGFYTVPTGDFQVYRADTPDGGWTRVSPPGVWQTYRISGDPTRPDTLFAASIALVGSPVITDVESCAFRSDDRGATWTRLLAGLPPPIDDRRRIAFIEADANVPDRVWLGHRLQDGTTGPALFRSDDRGATWQTVGAGIVDRDVVGLAFLSPTSLLARVDSGRGPYDFGGMSVVRSDDVGLTWSDHAQGLPARREVTALAVDPGTPGRVYAVVAEETPQAPYFVSRLYRREAAGVWSELPSVAALRLAPTSRSLPEPVEATTIAVDPTDPDRLYLGVVRYGVLVSDDAGATFRPATTGMSDPLAEFVTPFELLVDAADPRRALVATFDGLYRTHDRAGTWRRQSATGLPAPTCPLASTFPGIYARF